VHLAAQEQHLKHIETSVAKTYNVPPEEMRGWWRRKMYFVTSTVSMAALGTATAFGAKSALAGTAAHTALAGVLGTTFGPAVLGAAAAIPVVMAVRWGLGMYNEDRRVRAGRDSDKMKKRARKLHKDAARLGATLNVDPAAVESQAKALSRRVSWGTVAANIGVGAFTGALTAEALAGGAKPVTTYSGRAFGSVWERVSSGNWWYQQASGVWNALFGAVSGEATPAVRAPAATHLAACDGAYEHIRALETDLSNVRARAAGLDRMVSDLEASVIRLGDENAISSTSRRLLSDRLNALRAEYADLQTRLLRSELTGVTLAEHVRILSERGSELEEEIRQLAAENARLRQPVPAQPGMYDAPRGAPYQPYVQPPAFAVPSPGPFADLPPEVTITRGMARGGLDNLLRETILSRLNFASPLVENQLIEAVRAAFIADPESAAQLLGSDRGIIRNGDLVFHAGRIADMTIFGDEHFLDRLFDEITARGRGAGGHKYAALMEYLSRGPRGPAGFVEALHAAYRYR
jgi:hypothetical protein